ncbi:MAG: radical SAM protein [Planctomycetota bacterium]
MYLQITTRCNMTCEHCCYSCGKDGEDMSLEVYRKALELCVDHDEAPFIGGGEPTLHPNFDTILMEGIASPRDSWQTLGIITNGSITKRAKMLASLAGHKVIHAELSQDQYHDPIDAEVVAAFEELGRHYTRDTSMGGTRDPILQGRALEFMGVEDDDLEHDGWRCPCDTWFVKPDGNIYQCGCDDAPKIGDVYDGIASPLNGECHHSSYFTNACLEENGQYEHLLY